MAIVLRSPDRKGLVGPMNGVPFLQEVIVIADTEEEITALGGHGSVVQETFGNSDMAVKVAAGSTAVTVVDEKAVTYLLLPGGWAKTGG